MQRRDLGSVWVWPSSRGAFGRDKARWSQESGTLKPSNEWQNATGVYWVNLTIPRGSVGDVLAIIHSVLYPGDQKFQLTLFKPKIDCTMIMDLSHKATSARQEWMKWQSNSRKNLTPCSASCITPRHRWTALYSALSESSHPWICTGHEWWRIPASQKESVLNCSPYLRGSRERESYELQYKECSLVPALSSWKLGLEQFSISHICQNIDISYSILSAWCHPNENEHGWLTSQLCSTSEGSHGRDSHLQNCEVRQPCWRSSRQNCTTSLPSSITPHSGSSTL